jgi:outer membrane protein assembly factor BamB
MRLTTVARQSALLLVVGVAGVAGLAAGTAGTVRADDWPQWLGPRRDGVWRETGILEKFPARGPTIKWRTPIGGGYAGPAVAGGKVYVTDRQLPKGVENPANPFARDRVAGKERVLCLDAANGKVLWTHEYDCPYRISYPVGPRTTPLVAGGKVYTLGAMGDLFCLNADSGKVLWSKNFPRDYGASVALWGYASHPLLDGNKLICLVGGKGSVVVAFDKDSGKELWKSLDLTKGELGYCPPMIFEAGGKRQLWLPEEFAGLDPETGKPYWQEKFRTAIKANMTIPTPRKEGNLLFLTSFYGGSLMLKLDRDRPAASVLWKKRGRSEQPDRTEALHAVMCTPVFKGEYIYGICSYGELRCIKAATGERVWEDLKATGSKKQDKDRWDNVFIIEQGDRYFLFTEKGDLVIARFTPDKDKGYEEISRGHVLEPTSKAGFGFIRSVLWSHPAFAGRCMFARNDKEIVCVSLAADPSK